MRTKTTLLFLLLFLQGVVPATALSLQLTEGTVFQFEFSRPTGGLLGFGKQTTQTSCLVTVTERSASSITLNTKFSPLPDYDKLSKEEQRKLYFYYPEEKITILHADGSGLDSLASDTTKWRMVLSKISLFKTPRMLAERYARKPGDNTWTKKRYDIIAVKDPLVYDLTGLALSFMEHKDAIVNHGQIYLWEKYLRRLVQIECSGQDCNTIKASYDGKHLFTLSLSEKQGLPQELKFHDGSSITLTFHGSKEQYLATQKNKALPPKIEVDSSTKETQKTNKSATGTSEQEVVFTIPEKSIDRFLTECKPHQNLQPTCKDASRFTLEKNKQDDLQLRCYDRDEELISHVLINKNSEKDCFLETLMANTPREQCIAKGQECSFEKATIAESVSEKYLQVTLNYKGSSQRPSKSLPFLPSK